MQTYDRDAMIEGLARMWQQSGGKIILPFAQIATAIAAPADGAENNLVSVGIPPAAMGLNGILRVSATVSHNNNANAKTVRLRWGPSAGGTVIASDVATTGTLTRIQGTISNRGATNSQRCDMHVFAGSGGGTLAVIDASANTAFDTLTAATLNLTALKAVGGDTITLEEFLVELITTL